MYFISEGMTVSDISLRSRAAADIRRAQDTRPGPAWSHMQFCTLFAEFQSQVGKILILAINIPPRLAGRRMLAAAGAAALRLGLRRGPDFLTCHVTRVASAAGTHSVFLQAGRGKSLKHVTWARYGQEKTANLKSIHTKNLGKLLQLWVCSGQDHVQSVEGGWTQVAGGGTVRVSPLIQPAARLSPASTATSHHQPAAAGCLFCLSFCYSV